jgi:hypothetical protein
MMPNRQRRLEPFDVSERTTNGEPFVVSQPALSEVEGNHERCTLTNCYSSLA